MSRLDCETAWAGVKCRALAFITGATVLTCLGLLLVVAPTHGDWWPYSTASAPFTLKLKAYYYGRAGAGVLWKVETQAQRADGATVIVDTLYYPHMPPHSFRQVRLADGTLVRFVDAASAKFTCRPQRREGAPARATLPGAPTPPSCLGDPGDKLLGRTVLFGQQVDIVKTWDLGSGGEVWLAPALGCKRLQSQKASLQPNGSRRVEMEERLVSLRLGEPDARLFDLRPSYAEVKLPSDLLRREMKVEGVAWNPELAGAAEQEDRLFGRACQVPAIAPQ